MCHVLTFGYIVSLSGAFLIEELPHRTNDTVNVLERRDYAESIWGNLDQVAESENNPKYLVRRIKEENVEFPEVYIACGEQDSLRDVNLGMYHFLKENGVNAVYESGAGIWGNSSTHKNGCRLWLLSLLCALQESRRTFYYMDIRTVNGYFF